MAQSTYQSQNKSFESFDENDQRFKTKADFDNYEENDLDSEYLRSFCAELLKDFRDRDYSSLNEEQRKILSNFPGDLEKLLKVIEELRKQEEIDKQEELEDHLNKSQDQSFKSKRSAKREQRKIERQEKLKEVSGELFIASCASTKSVEDSLKFHKKCNLGVEELNKFNKNGVNPIVAILASGKDVKELSKFLKVSGVDVNYKDKDGNTALHNAAAMNMDKKFLEVLVEHGANVNAKNNFGLTAFDVAAIKGDEKSAAFLLEKGGKSGLAEKIPDLGEQKEDEAKDQKNQKMQEMLKKIKEVAKKEEGQEKDDKQRQIKKEPKKDNNELENKERERLKLEKIRQERLRQEEMKARMNAEIELAFKLHQERMSKLLKENVAKKALVFQKEQQEQYDREVLEKQNAEITRYSIEKLEYEKKIQEIYSQDKFLKDEQNISRQESRENHVEESNLLVNQVKIDNVFNSLSEQNNSDNYKSLLANNFIDLYSHLKESLDREIKTEESKPFSPIEEILGVKLSEITSETINKMLFEAVRKNQYILSNILIICGADVNHREGGITVLEVAESSGNKSLVTAILNKVNETATFQNKDFLSLLHANISEVFEDKKFNASLEKPRVGEDVGDHNLTRDKNVDNDSLGKPRLGEGFVVVGSDVVSDRDKNVDNERSSLEKPRVGEDLGDHNLTRDKNVDNERSSLEKPRLDEGFVAVGSVSGSDNLMNVLTRNVKDNISSDSVGQFNKSSIPSSSPIVKYKDSLLNIEKKKLTSQSSPKNFRKVISFVDKVLSSAASKHNYEERDSRNLGQGIDFLSVRILNSVLHDPKQPTQQNISELEIMSEKGNSDATVKLGLVYVSNPIDKDEERRGLELLRKEGESGNIIAQKALGEFYYHESSKDLVVENVRQAIEWFEKAAQQGDQSATHNLGVIHYACFTKGLDIYGDRNDHYKKAEDLFGKLDDKKLADKELARLKSAKSFLDQPSSIASVNKSSVHGR